MKPETRSAKASPSGALGEPRSANFLTAKNFTEHDYSNSLGFSRAYFAERRHTRSAKYPRRYVVTVVNVIVDVTSTMFAERQPARQKKQLCRAPPCLRARQTY